MIIPKLYVYGLIASAIILIVTILLIVCIVAVVYTTLWAERMLKALPEEPVPKNESNSPYIAHIKNIK